VQSNGNQRYLGLRQLVVGLKLRMPQSMGKFLWTKWHKDRLSPSISGFPSVSFHQCYTWIHASPTRFSISNWRRR